MPKALQPNRPPRRLNTSPPRQPSRLAAPRDRYHQRLDLDTGALLAYANHDTYARAVVASCRARGRTVLICDTALAAALDARPDAFEILLELRRHPTTWLAELTATNAAEVGTLLARTNGDIEVAHLVHEATNRRWPILSDRREQLLAVENTLLVEPV